ncbi:Acyl-CoA thioesterase I precursor [Cardiobacterium hominis]|uniref:GDSL-like protein n=1 Tax=Cardiobacterium hominis (strain ATCC 15826 / DSM 8339 / NCTC 10426 / 6573) TaxID=638300 RepID=C8NBE0_CARH6|nr:arylesterase [Cardiobacterium hominis]EEV88108.1 GDSL-like protein [Cardiobacterium hominis ATCC 15826]VEG77865.1 Acyl-CoA thioesterase I precursor [Cardiobacterium hominis]
MNRRHFLLLTAAALAACGKKAPKHSALPRGSAVLALGDSLTYGYGANPTESYPARLAELTGWTVTNGGVSGDTSAQALARLPELLREHTPRLVIISIGGNDFLRRQPENETRTNIRAIIQACKAAGAETLLVGVPGVGVGAALGYPGDHPLYTDLAKAENVPYYANGWSQILGKDALKSDQIHPNAAGYAEFARGLTAYLKENGWLR